MKFSTLSKAGVVTLLGATLIGTSLGVQAGTQDSIFGNVEPALRERMFFRLNAIHAQAKTTAQDAYDVTGPVLSRADLQYVKDNGSNFFEDNAGDPLDYTTAANLLLSPTAGLTRQADRSGCASVRDGLGTPCGLRGRGSNRLSALALSVGYFLDEEYKWAVEAFVLSAPLKASVYGLGANGMNGKRMIDTKLLPPMVTFGRYFGTAKDALRPYLGAVASYAIFFDTRATNELNTYQAGSSEGDTTVKIKNAFGVGPMVGFKYEPPTSDWHLSFSIGKVRYKTEATLITNNTVIKDGAAVLGDYGAYITNAIVGGNNTYAQSNNGVVVTTTGAPVGYTAGQSVSLTEALMCDVAKNKNNSDACNLGTYVRKSSTVLDNTLFMLSVGHRF